MQFSQPPEFTMLTSLVIECWREVSASHWATNSPGPTAESFGGEQLFGTGSAPARLFQRPVRVLSLRHRTVASRWPGRVWSLVGRYEGQPGPTGNVKSLRAKRQRNSADAALFRAQDKPVERSLKKKPRQGRYKSPVRCSQVAASQ